MTLYSVLSASASFLPGIRLALIPLLIICQAGLLPGQEFLIVNSDRELYTVDVNNCTLRYVSAVWISSGGSISDITYTNDGRLWGITTDGRLYLITESSGQTVLIHTFPNSNEPFFTALVADEEGQIYAAGGNGDLYAFDINTLQHTYLGNIGFGAAGDLTFYQGQLIMASTTNQMVAIDLDNPANSAVLMNFNAGGQIFGIVTFVEDCDNTVTYATNHARNGVVLQVDFEAQQVSPVCTLNTRIFGAASQLEFLAANPVLVDTVRTVPTSCIRPEGIIDLQASGGNGPLSYSLDNINFQSSGLFTGLSPGDYMVYIQDGQGCSARQMTTVDAIDEAPEIISLTVQADSCGLGIGAITVEAAGGLLPYQYALNGGIAMDEPQFSGLFGGVYEIAVIDNRGCRAAQTATLPGQAAPQIERIGIQACGPGQTTVTVDAGGGQGGLLYSIGSLVQTDPALTGLDAGMFLVVVTDEAGCTDSETIEVPAVSSLEITAIDIQACGQGNSSLVITAAGGNAPFTYQFSGRPPQNSGFFEQLDAGMYSLLVTDRNGCTIAGTTSIPEYDAPRIIEAVVTPSQCGTPSGGVQVETEGGTTPFLYALNGVEQMEPEFSSLAPGLFLLSVVDAEGCSTQDSVSVGQRCPVYIPNAFSPNDDGRNDRFGFYSTVEVNILHFRIFNRWGGLVYEKSDFGSMDTAQYWDGCFKEQPAPVGVYAFYVELVNVAGEAEFYEGEVMLVR